jgi:ABC-type lipoprotein release transport system permease subunit
VATTDAATALGVVVFLLIVGGTAALIPAWRATHIDPIGILQRP